MATAPAVPPQETAPLTQVQRVIYTFTAPNKVFTDLRRSASWWLPFVLIAVVWLAFVYVVDQKIGFRKITENQIEMVPKAAAQFEQLTPEVRNQQIEARTKGTRYFSYGKTLLRLLWFVIIAAVLFATFKLGFSANLPFKAAFAVVVYASLPFAVKLLLGIASLGAGVMPEVYSPDNPIASNPAYFMNPGDSLVRYSLAVPFDIFEIWTLVLAGIGLSCVSKLKRSTALMGVLGWYVLLALVGVGIAAAFS